MFSFKRKQLQANLRLFFVKQFMHICCFDKLLNVTITIQYLIKKTLNVSVYFMADIGDFCLLWICDIASIVEK